MHGHMNVKKSTAQCNVLRYIISNKMKIILIRRFLRLKHTSDMFRSIMEHLHGESHQVLCVKLERGLKT